MAGGEVRTLFAGGTFFKRIGNALARALAFESVLIYALGLVFFFVIPYAILFVPFTPKGNKTDFAFFILRLVLSFIFSLIGWVITISALTKNSLETSLEPSPDKSPAVAWRRLRDFYKGRSPRLRPRDPQACMAPFVLVRLDPAAWVSSASRWLAGAQLD
jgi:hypothetical protein